MSSCGIVGSDLPIPSDPSNDISLTANTVYTGINVRWSYPSTNAFAVAHTLLFRSEVNNFDSAIQIAIVGGSVYLDKLNPTVNTTYYYWIRVVSRNGTTAPVIGPASAVAVPTPIQTLESLTGLIDNSRLAIALRTEINKITIVDGKIAGETLARINAVAGLATALDNVANGLTEALQFISEEVTQRQEGDSASIQAVQALGTAIGESISLILNFQTTQVTKNTAFAEDIEQLFVKTGLDNAASILEVMQTFIDQDNGIAERLTQTEVAIDGDITSGQIGLKSEIDQVTGALGTMYLMKVQTNGLLGGFGLYNDGNIVDAGFDVDRFWIGRTGPDKVKPFIIDNGTVYINKARIRDADIDTLKIAGDAVTITKVANGVGNITGGSSKVILTVSITVAQDGWYVANAAIKQDYPSGLHPWSFDLRFDGVNVFSTNGIAGYADSVALCGAKFLTAGTHSITVHWLGHSSMSVMSRTLTVISAVR